MWKRLLKGIQHAPYTLDRTYKVTDLTTNQDLAHFSEWGVANAWKYEYEMINNLKTPSSLSIIQDRHRP